MQSRLFIARVLCLLGLVASAAGLGEMLFESHEFCGFESGCDEVAASPYARPLGIPLPAVGAVGFGLVFVTTLLPGQSVFGFVRPLAIIAGLVGLILVGIQVFVINRFCLLCLVADLSGVGLAVISLIGRFRGDLVRLSPPVLIVWISMGVLAAGLPIFWDWAATVPSVPDQVVALQMPGKITIVEVTDFDCPHCVRADAIMKEILKNWDGVHFVRVVSPMPSHPNGRPAARAYLAAVKQNKGEEMAAALYSSPEHTEGECRRLAASVGLNLTDYDRVVADPATTMEINATYEWTKKSGNGLPLIWVQDKLLMGAPTPDQLQDALKKAGAHPKH